MSELGDLACGVHVPQRDRDHPAGDTNRDHGQPVRVAPGFMPRLDRERNPVPCDGDQARVHERTENRGPGQGRPAASRTSPQGGGPGASPAYDTSTTIATSGRIRGPPSSRPDTTRSPPAWRRRRRRPTRADRRQASKGVETGEDTGAIVESRRHDPAVPEASGGPSSTRIAGPGHGERFVARRRPDVHPKRLPGRQALAPSPRRRHELVLRTSDPNALAPGILRYPRPLRCDPQQAVVVRPTHDETDLVGVGDERDQAADGAPDRRDRRPQHVPLHFAPTQSPRGGRFLDLVLVARSPVAGGARREAAGSPWQRLLDEASEPRRPTLCWHLCDVSQRLTRKASLRGAHYCNRHRNGRVPRRSFPVGENAGHPT